MTRLVRIHVAGVVFILVTGSVVQWREPSLVVETREPFHIEPQQYDEPSRPTYENPYSTATVTRYSFVALAGTLVN